MTTVTKEMIGAAHDVMLAKGDFVLSAAILERIYLAMEQTATPNVELRGRAAGEGPVERGGTNLSAGLCGADIGDSK